MEHDEFERDLKRNVAALAGGAVSGLKVLYLAADLGPWLDTGLALQPDDRVTIVLRGRVWLSFQYDVSLEPALQVWRQVGEGGPISRGLRATDTFIAGKAGPLRLKNLPTRWLDSTGRYAGEPAPVNPDAGGGVSVALIRWAPGADVARELARLSAAPGRPKRRSSSLGEDVAQRQEGSPVSAAGRGPAWATEEAARLERAIAPPAGWQYLWELGPAEIFSETSGACGEGGPQRCLHAHTRNDVAILQKAASAPLTPATTLQWAWKVDALPARGPEDAAVAHDYLSIAVEFDNGQDLTYFWSRELPVGTSFRCPLEGWKDRETHIVARSGSGELGRWLTESRRVWDDYREAVGGPLPERIVRVWLIANSVFGRGEGRAHFGDIRLGAGEAIVRVW